jgi:hypothetical protein
MTDQPITAQIAAASAAEILRIEEALGRGAVFDGADALLTSMLRQAARRSPVVAAEWGQRSAATIELTGLTDDDRATLERDFRLGVQETRGAWYLPREATVAFGWCNYPATAASGARFAVNAAREQSAKTSLHNSPDALATWALVAPFFADLFAPIAARTAGGKLLTEAQTRTQWVDIADLYTDLGLDVDEQLTAVASGARWVAMGIDEQRSALAGLCDAVLYAATDDTARRWRARQVRALTAAFGRKAKKEPPLARQVLTKQMQPLLSAVFGGSWMAMLDYLGEQPNEAEEIAGALPEPKLFVGSADRASTVADDHGIAVDEVQRMLAAYMGQTAGASPVEERVSAMRDVWAEFDRLHAKQASGMTSLSGLLDDGATRTDADNATDPLAARTQVAPHLDAEIKRLWDGATLPRWPERIVSEFHPYQRMAKAFGPALALWSGVALTCWYVCEGPWSRTDLAGLAVYHQRDLEALEALGCPVAPDLFADLVAAESKLGPVQQLSRGTTSEVGGISISISMSTGTRRDGFEHLRDVVTAHRRAWAEEHLDSYLRVRWDSELREVAREFQRRLAARGKPPTVKQFASFAAESANNWFGGDLAAVFAALGETSPIRTQRIDLLEREPLPFVVDLTAELTRIWDLPPHDPDQYSPDDQKHWQARRLASDALKYLQLQEALDRPPTPKEFNADRYTWSHFGDRDSAWRQYTDAIERLRTRADAPRPQAPPAPSPPPAVPAAPTEPPPATPPPPPAWVSDQLNQPGSAPRVERRPRILDRFRRR